MIRRGRALIWQAVVVYHASRVERLAVKLEHHMAAVDDAEKRVEKLIPDGWVH
jgi:hypothetical protein